jgi:hypothetical protein
MEEISKVIKEALSGLTTSGIKRLQYMPYNLDYALSVIDSIGKGIDPKFTLTKNVIGVYADLIRYFHGDPQFDQDYFPGALEKGILLMGPTGSGKSMAMQIMSIYRQIDDTKFILNGKCYRMNYEVIDVNKIVNDFMLNAYDGIKVHCNRYVTCLDDIGTESEEVKYYGNNLDVISYILSERYANKRLTFGTTNFNVDKLEEKYGDRIISRMYVLFNFITMKGQDFRKT